MIQRKCVICGKAFECYPSDNKVTCSKACSRERQRLRIKQHPIKWSDEAKARAAQRGRTANLKLGTAAAQQSPIAGRFETNQEAKVWLLVDPAGREYTVRNLLLWAREHTDLFDKSPGDKSAQQIASGFDEYKETMYQYPCTIVARTIREINDYENPFARKRERARRRTDIIMAFWGDEERARLREYASRPEVKERNAIRNERKRELRQRFAADKAKATVVLPCGEDCDNCPYDDCIYTDEDRDKLLREHAVAAKRGYQRKWERQNPDKVRAKMTRWRSKPESRQAALDYAREYRQAHKDDSGWKAKHREDTRAYYSAHKDDPEFKAKRAKAQKRRRAEPGAAEKRRAAERAYYAAHKDDPEYMAKRRKKQQKFRASHPEYQSEWRRQRKENQQEEATKNGSDEDGKAAQAKG